MISKNITRENILKAVSEIDKDSIPLNRHSKKYKLYYKGKPYPPKYVLSIANKYANGQELSPNAFSGGTETNSFLMNLGFEIREGHEKIAKKPGESKANLWNLYIGTGLVF